MKCEASLPLRVWRSQISCEARQVKIKKGVNYFKKGDPRYEDGFNLGQWISRQRVIYNGKGHGKLTEEQIKLLEDLKIKWMKDTIDDRSQKEDITEKNKLQKKTEVLNRFQTLLNKYNGESLPNREEISDDFMNQLNRKVLCQMMGESPKNNDKE